MGPSWLPGLTLPEGASKAFPAPPSPSSRSVEARRCRSAPRCALSRPSLRAGQVPARLGGKPRAAGVQPRKSVPVGHNTDPSPSQGHLELAGGAGAPGSRKCLGPAGLRLRKASATQLPGLLPRPPLLLPPSRPALRSPAGRAPRTDPAPRPDPSALPSGLALASPPFGPRLPGPTPACPPSPWLHSCILLPAQGTEKLLALPKTLRALRLPKHPFIFIVLLITV